MLPKQCLGAELANISVDFSSARGHTPVFEGTGPQKSGVPGAHSVTPESEEIQDHVPVLVHGPSQVVSLTPDSHEDLIRKPDRDVTTPVPYPRASRA